MPTIIALYRCLRCPQEWEGRPGVWDGVLRHGQPEAPLCPSCGSLYLLWTNYKETFGCRRTR